MGDWVFETKKQLSCFQEDELASRDCAKLGANQLPIRAGFGAMEKETLFSNLVQCPCRFGAGPTGDA